MENKHKDSDLFKTQHANDFIFLSLKYENFPVCFDGGHAAFLL